MKTSISIFQYGILLCIVILIQITGIVISFVFQEDAEKYIKEGITKSLAAYGGIKPEEEAYTTALNLAQVTSFTLPSLNMTHVDLMGTGQFISKQFISHLLILIQVTAMAELGFS